MKVCDILDKHTEEMNKNPEFISYELLDNSLENPNSVESIYH